MITYKVFASDEYIAWKTLSEYFGYYNVNYNVSVHTDTITIKVNTPKDITQFLLQNTLNFECTFEEIQ